MMASRSPSSLGNFSCSERKDACASASLRCEDTCTKYPPAAAFAAAAGEGIAAVRGAGGVRARCVAGARSPSSAGAGGLSERGAAGAARWAGLAGDGAAEADALGGGLVRRPLASVPSGRIGRVAILFGSPDVLSGAEAVPCGGGRDGAGGKGHAE